LSIGVVLMIGLSSSFLDLCSDSSKRTRGRRVERFIRREIELARLAIPRPAEFSLLARIARTTFAGGSAARSIQTAAQGGGFASAT
jgi:hypothetical protein